MERVNDDTKSYLLGFQTTDSYTTEVLQLFNADAVIKNAYITFISTDKTDAVKIFDTMDIDGGVYKDNKEFYEGKNICPVEYPPFPPLLFPRSPPCAPHASNV